MLKNLYKETRFYSDIHDCIFDILVNSEKRFAGQTMGYKVSLIKLFQHICLHIKDRFCNY